MTRARTAFAILLALQAGIALAEEPKPHTVAELLRPSVIRDVSLSPDGSRIALAGKFGEIDNTVAIVDVEKLGDPAGMRRLAFGTEPGVTPLWVWWANDRRLLVATRGAPDIGPFIARRQVQAIDADGSNPVKLFADSKHGTKHELNLPVVVDITPDDPEHVILQAWNWDTNDLFRVNVQTGVATLMVRGRASTLGWETEGGLPALRYDVNRRGTEMRVYGRDAEDPEDWSLIAKIRREDVQKEWEYAGDAPGAGTVFVRARRAGADTYGIYSYDLRRKTLGEAVAQVPGYDMSSTLAINSEYAGAMYVADTGTYLLKDPKLQSHWNGVYRYFHGKANVRIVEVDRARSRMLLHVTGPQAPGDYYVYDVAKANLAYVASDQPWLEPDRLASVEAQQSPMRDGTTITSYLTRPIGATGALPLVVMPHGGPEKRDAITYDPVAQAFAAQGWLVLQPNFRGSSGFGRAFAEAGHRQWAKRMQDDLTDAVDELVRRGVADPKRIVIYGASYGGYAALMGAILTPDRYRAAVSVAGVTDLNRLVAHVRREDGDDSATYQYVLRAIGDPKTDKAALDAISPVMRAGDVAVPVLLMHGTEDIIVPARQSEAMERALKKAGKPVRYIAFEGNGHSHWGIEDEIRQVEETIAFFMPFLTR